MASRKRRRQPILFGLEVTRRCNLSCPHCFTGAGRDGHPGPSREALRELLRQLVGVGARRIALSGGEPLVRRDLEAILEDGRGLGLESYSLVTNGALATTERVARLAAAGLVTVQVSVDGVDARDHCGIRQCSAGAYYRALRAVRLFREAGVKVDIATILAGPNLRRVAELAGLGAALGVRNVRYCAFVPTGRGAAASIQQRFVPAPEEIDAFLERLRQAAELENARPNLVIDHAIGPWRSDGRFQCVAGREVAYITSEGDLYPCPSLMHPPFRVGNVFETPLGELLSRPELHQVRTLSRHELEEPCRSCPNERCSGGCRGAVYAACGDVRAAPAYCNHQRRAGGKVADGAADESGPAALADAP